MKTGLVFVALLGAPQALVREHSHTLAQMSRMARHRLQRDPDGVLDFELLTQSSSLHEVSDPDSKPTSGKDSAAWAIVDSSNVVEGSTNVGATVDDQGRITLQSAVSGGDPGSFVASGSMSDQLDQNGWISLNMRLSEKSTAEDGVKMYAAGVVEGFLTAERIREFHDNSRDLIAMTPANHQRLPVLKEALGKMVADLAEKAENKDTAADPFDNQVRLALLQTWGIRDGYAVAVKQSDQLRNNGATPLSMVDMFILNSDGVIDELLTKYAGPDPSDTSLLQTSVVRQLRGGKSTPRRPRVSSLGHCTGFVRLSDNNDELYFGHTTWESFSEMTRVWKVYDFPLKGASMRKVSFSSYPGCVSSTDDYYLMDSGLAVTETTLSIPKKQPDYSTSAAVPDFIRIMAANRMSKSAEDWVENMDSSATGTYSSQWLVVDYKKFKQGQDLEPGTFYVLEQAPGSSHFEDQSSVLQGKRYWADFDRAYYDVTRAATGDDEAVAKAGSNAALAEVYSKDRTPRAQVAKATQASVNSLDAMRDEMTRNKGKDEPVDQEVLQSPRWTISARDDLGKDGLRSDQGSPDGGVDAKITSSCLFKSLSAQAISSPSHSSLPAFSWKENGQETFPGYPHEGLPETADFEWQRMNSQDDNIINSLDNGECK
jgi:hypothetical protein